MLRAKKKRAAVAGFDLTPMIDVVLQLIIFFMFTSQFGRVSRTVVDLPVEQGEDAPETPAALVIDITLEGAYVIDAKPLSFDRVLGVVEREVERFGDASDVTVLIRPDQRATAAALNRLAEELATMGVRRWSIATRKGDG